MMEQISSIVLIIVATGMLLIGIYYLYYLLTRKVNSKQAEWGTAHA